MSETKNPCGSGLVFGVRLGIDVHRIQAGRNWTPWGCIWMGRNWS